MRQVVVRDMERFHLVIEYRFSWVTDSEVSSLMGTRNKVGAGTDFQTGRRDRQYRYRTRAAAERALERLLSAQLQVDARVDRWPPSSPEMIQDTIAMGPLRWR